MFKSIIIIILLIGFCFSNIIEKQDDFDGVLNAN
jgi:hypothetical protein